MKIITTKSSLLESINVVQKQFLQNHSSNFRRNFDAKGGKLSYCNRS